MIADYNMDLYIAVRDFHKTQGWRWEHTMTGRVEKHSVHGFGTKKTLILKYINSSGKAGTIVLFINKITSITQDAMGITIEGFPGGIFIKEGSSIMKINGLKYRLVLYGDVAPKVKNEVEKAFDIFA